MIADSLQAEALLEYICRRPGEDDTRLALADVLEERGEGARAELIRVQVELANGSLCPLPRKPAGVGGYHVPRLEAMRRKHRRIALRRRERELINGYMPKWLGELPAFPGGWLCVNSHPNPMLGGPSVLFRRGFPAEVSLTALAFAGGPCRACMEPNEDVPHPRCRVCHGKGCPGHAAALFRGAPIEKVTLSDKGPERHQRPGADPNWSWFLVGFGDDAATLPDVLFELLPGGWPAMNGQRLVYPTEQAALDALAAAALLLGRRRGWPCPRCKGTGRHAMQFSEGVTVETPCDTCEGDCGGTGHTVETPA